MSGRIVLAITLALALFACSKPDSGAPKDAGEKPLLISSEDLLTIQPNSLALGPVITGSVQPARRADLRAEVSAVVLQVMKENGDPVKRGDLLVRLDDSAIRDNQTSADEAVRAAGQSFDQAERQLQRLKKLRESGMVTTQQFEDSEIRRNTTQSELAAARTRQAQARQQLQRTEARAPFDGIVSDRKVSAGDTAQIGKELLKVIDPGSLRFEGLVSADMITNVKVGQTVSFRINGYGQQEFVGAVTRVSPAANAATRQVEVQVGFTGETRPKLSGLYAEGRVASGGSALTIPAGSLMREGDKAYAWRLERKPAGNELKKILLTVGLRDPRRGEFVVREGLAAGDQVLRNPSVTLKDGQTVEIASPTVAVQPATTPDR